jgi:hypothetical protein
VHPPAPAIDRILERRKQETQMQEPTTNAESPPTWKAVSPEGEPATGTIPSDDVVSAGGATPGGATPGGSNRRNLGIAALAGAIGIGALAIGIAIGGSAATGGSATIPATDHRPAVVSDAAWTSPDGSTRVRLDERGGRGLWDGIGRTSISITAISGSRLSLETENGWTRTIDAVGATITKDGETATLSALQVGDRIRFTETRNDDGTYTVTAIVVVRPTVAGTVKEKSASSITLTTRDGSTVVVKVDSATAYKVDGVTSPTLVDIKVGAAVMASGTRNADGSLTATVLRSWAAGTDGGPGMGGWGGWDRGGPGMGGWGGWDRGGPGWDMPDDHDALPAPSSEPSGSGTNG